MNETSQIKRDQENGLFKTYDRIVLVFEMLLRNVYIE